ncbi:ABC transporter substrate-binding protein [Demequina aurantiaca]|uniref:ABC transporter substrate-binding protein n=1 Tax=Demequina aurantiaca TaxID=676200 RepID=UPI003D32ADC2
MRFNNTMRAGGALLLASALLAGCSSSEEAPESSSSASSEAAAYGDITVQLSWVPDAEFGGEFMADDRGYFADAGFESVTFLPGPSATESLVLSGQADLGISTPAALAPVVVEEGAPLKIIATEYQANPSAMMSLADSGINEPADLIGKTIGVQPGNTELIVDGFLEANGIDPSQVTKVPVTYDPMDLVNGGVDAMPGYVTNEPLVLADAGYDVSLMKYEDFGLPYVTKSYIATDESIAERPEELTAFLTALAMGWRDSIADPDETVRLATDVYGADLGLDVDTEARLVGIQNADLLVSDETAANGLLTISDETKARSIASLALIGYDVTAEQIFDTTLIDAVYAAHPELLN